MGGEEKKTAVDYWISQAEEEAAKQHSLEKLQRQQTERSTQAYARAQSILHEYGIVKKIRIVTGAGGRIIGSHHQLVDYRETLPVVVQDDHKEGKIYLKGMIGSRSGYRTVTDSLNLIYENNEGKSETLVVMKEKGVSGSSGEAISLGEFASLHEVLDFLEEDYKEREKEINEQKAANTRPSPFEDLFKERKASAE